MRSPCSLELQRQDSRGGVDLSLLCRVAVDYLLDLTARVEFTGN
jgi:hypothetical protein